MNDLKQVIENLIFCVQENTSFFLFDLFNNIVFLVEFFEFFKIDHSVLISVNFFEQFTNFIFVDAQFKSLCKVSLEIP